MSTADKGNQDAKSGRIEIGNSDRMTLERTLVYIYTGVYDENGAYTFDYIQPAVLRPSEDMVVIESSTINASVPGPGAGGLSPDDKQKVLNVNGTKNGDEVAVNKNPSRCTCKRYRPSALCINTKLQAHALLYILAASYQIEDLKKVARDKFVAAARSLCLENVDQVFLFAYKTAPMAMMDLQPSLLQAITSNEQQFLQDETFMNTISVLPSLCRDLLVEMAKEKNVAISAKQDALAAEYKACATARVAQADLDYLKETINENSCCPHCESDNIASIHGGSVICADCGEDFGDVEEDSE